MGTNFYWITEIEGIERHIGKRSAAGTYCWDCRKTLCMRGEAAIHGVSPENLHYGECPRCGQRIEPGAHNSVLVELGFAPALGSRPKTGVHAVASFTWAQCEKYVLDRCQADLDRDIIVDEYGKRLTGRQFMGMLEANCPINFYAIGVDFS